MGRRIGLKLVCLAAVAGFLSAGALGYEAVSQWAGAVPPPVITTGYAAYPPPGSLPSSCPTDGRGVVQGLRFFLIPGPGTPARPAQWTTDPGPTGDYATLRSSRRFESFPASSVLPGDTVVALWDSWTLGCEGVGLSMSVKKTNGPLFDIASDQALVRDAAGAEGFAWCQSGTDPCLNGGVNRLQVVIPPAAVTCNFQLDLAVGAALETVGPHGSYYSASVRQQAQAAGLGTFNITGPTMVLDATNQGVGNCAAQPRVVIDKQWVGTGSQPPSNVPAAFSLTVTSVVSATDPTVLGTASCAVTDGKFGCDYRDAAAPTLSQNGLLVATTSMLTVQETGFPGNTVDVSFPVDVSSRFVTCPSSGGPCLFTITNTPPPTTTVVPPTTPTTVPPTATPTTEPDVAPTSIPPTLPATLPATGSSGTSPLLALSVVLVPLGAALIVVTRRRANAR
jgi:hypothetical protein